VLKDIKESISDTPLPLTAVAARFHSLTYALFSFNMTLKGNVTFHFPGFFSAGELLQGK